jgi:hypothetical protein
MVPEMRGNLLQNVAEMIEQDGAKVFSERPITPYATSAHFRVFTQLQS